VSARADATNPSTLLLRDARPGERWRLTLPPAPLFPDGQRMEGELIAVAAWGPEIPRHLHGPIRVAIRTATGTVYPSLRWVRAAERLDAPVGHGDDPTHPTPKETQ
jgi:hypothetical protein